MAVAAASTSTQFSFDHMASEVSAIVEDLRWLHLELTLRNRCAEALLQNAGAEEDVLNHAFGELRQKIGALELSVYVKDTAGFRLGFRDLEEGVPWAGDPVPWNTQALRYFSHPPRDISSQADVSHFTVNSSHVTAITTSVMVSRETLASILVVFPSSAQVPRLKKFLTGVASSLGLSLDHLRKPSQGDRGSAPGEAERTAGAAAGPDALRSLLDGMGFYCSLLSRRGIPLFLNGSLRRALGRDPETDGMISFFEGAFAAADRDRLHDMLAEADDAVPGGAKTAAMPVRLQDGSFEDAIWTVARLPQSMEGDAEYLLAGIPYPATQAGAGTRAESAVDDKAHFRLSKQYRFMLKYVPFPVVHLDESTDVIRNANPAFETVIGSNNWEGAPISEIASLTVHPSIGDAKPCTLSVITPNGITLTYRGMITSLVLFGKTVREVKLDPLESAGRTAST
jgi:PAS domain-containing protein